MILEKLSGEKFTASEKQVVDFIQQYPRVVINLSLEELAAETFVSQASIIRLSKKLGAKGFADFKIQLAAELSTFAQDEKEIPVDIPIPEGCATPDIARTFYNFPARPWTPPCMRWTSLPCKRRPPCWPMRISSICTAGANR